MRVTREQAAENRDRVLDAAGLLFCQQGFDAVGVAEVMKAAGLTHGGFYGQFASKDDLAVEVCARVAERSAARWEHLKNLNGDEPLAAIVASYLSTRHRNEAGSGCLMSTLAGDVARKGGAVRATFTTGVRRLLGVMTSVMPGRAERARREAALATMAGLVGAVVLSRAVDDAALSEEILAAARKAFGAAAEPPIEDAGSIDGPRDVAA